MKSTISPLMNLTTLMKKASSKLAKITEASAPWNSPKDAITRSIIWLVKEPSDVGALFPGTLKNKKLL